MRISVSFFKIRTITLLIVLCSVTIWKISQSETQNHLMHLPVEIYSSKELDSPKRHLFEDLLPIATRLQRGEHVPIADGVVGNWREDPRSLLFFLWDDLSTQERSTALKTLGFPIDTTIEQLLKGPQPKWFSNSIWYGDHSPIHRCC